MAKPWAEVEQSPQYQSLAPEQQAKARAQYFDQVVAPQLTDPAQLEKARAQFDAHTGSKADFSGVSATVDRAPKKKTSRVRDAVNWYGNQQLGIVDGLQHRLIDVPAGIAQAVGNVVNHGVQVGATAFNRLTGQEGQGNAVSRYAAGVAQRNAAKNQEMTDREAAYQARTEGNYGAMAGGAVGMVAPWVVGGVPKALATAGGAAARVLPATARVGQKVVSGGTQGAIVGALQPATGEGSYWGQKGLQVGVGGVTGGALPAAAAGARGVYNVGRHVVAPGSVARDNLVRNLGADASTLATLRNAPEYVPGETPTTAQVLANPRAVMTEKALRNNPEYKPQFEDIDNANNAARLDVLRRLGGTDEELLGAVQARRDAAAPFRSQNLPEDGSKLVDATPVIEVLQKRTLSANAAVRSAANEHLAIIKAQAKKGKVPAYLLDDVRQEVGGMLAKHAPQGVVGTKEAAKYAPVSAQIVRTLDRQVPGYRDYLGAYRDNSVPINTMETARRIVGPVDQRGLNSAGDSRLTLPALNTGLNRADKSRFGMSPQARQEVEGVRQSLQRESVSNSLRSAGSDTNYNAQAQGWLAKQMLGENLTGPTTAGRGIAAGVGGLAGFATGGPVGAPVGAGLSLLLKKSADVVNKRIMDRYAAGMKDPKEAARMIEQFLAQNPKEAPALLQQYPQWAALLSQEPLQ